MTAAVHGAIIVGALGRAVYRATSGTGSFNDWEEELVRSALAGVVSAR